MAGSSRPDRLWGRSRAAVCLRSLAIVVLALAPALRIIHADKTTPLFREVAAEVGLDFQHFLGATGEYYLVEVMGPGAALFDYDNDGDLDVYLLQGQLLQPGRELRESTFPPPKSHWPGHRLFRNEIIPGGSLRFTDVTDQAGVGHRGYGLGAAVGDYDNDGDKDLYVTNLGGNVLYQNNGDGTFTDVTAKAGVADEGFSTSAAFVDYDRDGDLDLFVAHYNTFTIDGNKRCKAPTGERDYCGPTSYFPLPDRLYRNEGNGRFRDVSQASGIGAATAAGLGIATADYNGDGWIDIYVANDMTPNHLWINKHDGTFEETGLISGTAYNQDGEVEAGMGVSAADFDADGDEDIFVTNLRGQTNTLYRNDGSGNFDDVTSRVGLDAPSVPFTGFGTQWFDYDNDGLLDLFVANGAIMMSDALRGQPFPYHERNQLYRFDGKTFQEATNAGAAFELSEVSRGAAFGDIDNDGDTDVLVANCNGPVRLLLNETGARNTWLQVAVEGVTANRDGLGSRVGLRRKGRPTLWRRVAADGSYLSAGDSRVQFGLGSAAESGGSTGEAVVVLWPDGTKEQWPVSKPNQLLKLKQGSGSPVE